MQFREFLNGDFGLPPSWKIKKKTKKEKKQDRRKFMSKVVTASEKDLDALADEMGEKDYRVKTRTRDNLHKWLLERREKIRQCLKLLSEVERCSSRPPKKWKNGDNV